MAGRHGHRRARLRPARGGHRPTADRAPRRRPPARRTGRPGARAPHGGRPARPPAGGRRGRRQRLARDPGPPPPAEADGRRGRGPAARTPPRRLVGRPRPPQPPSPRRHPPHPGSDQLSSIRRRYVGLRTRSSTRARRPSLVRRTRSSTPARRPRPAIWWSWWGRCWGTMGGGGSRCTGGSTTWRCWIGTGGAPAALHPRAVGRRRPLPDRLRRPARLGGGADRRPAPDRCGARPAAGRGCLRRCPSNWWWAWAPSGPSPPTASRTTPCTPSATGSRKRRQPR